MRPCGATTCAPRSDLGQEASKVSSHVGQHFLLLGLIVGPLLGLFVLLSLSLLLLKSSVLITFRLRQPAERGVVI